MSDRAGIISEQSISQAGPLDTSLDLRGYPSENEARADLANGNIAAYYVLPQGYPVSGDLALVALSEQPKARYRNAFVRLVRKQPAE